MYVILLDQWKYWDGEDWTYDYSEAKFYTLSEAEKEVARFTIPLKIIDIHMKGDESLCLPMKKESRSFSRGTKGKVTSDDFL